MVQLKLAVLLKYNWFPAPVLELLLYWSKSILKLYKYNCYNNYVAGSEKSCLMPMNVSSMFVMNTKIYQYTITLHCQNKVIYF